MFESVKSELEISKKNAENAIETVGAKDGEIEELNSKLKKAQTEVASSLSEFSDVKADFEKLKSELHVKIQTLEVELAKVKKNSDLFDSLSAVFVDPVSKNRLRCPIIQNNGIIRSFSEIICIWVKEANMGQSNTFRMYPCPVNRNFTTISPFPIVDSFSKLALLSGVDVSIPMSFWFKGIEGVFVEFSFHEQLELISRLCGAYSQRNDFSKPPEQRCVSVAGMSFVVSIRFIAQEGSKHLLECFGICNNGKGKIDIIVRFDADWVHPFSDVIFPDVAV